VLRHQRRPEPCSEKDEAQRRRCGNDPCSELARSERHHRRRLQLVKQRRLVEEELTVEMRRPPVAGREHLARCLRVMCLVGIPERRRAEPPKEHDEDEHRGQRHERQFVATPEIGADGGGVDKRGSWPIIVGLLRR